MSVGGALAGGVRAVDGEAPELGVREAPSLEECVQFTEGTGQHLVGRCGHRQGRLRRDTESAGASGRQGKWVLSRRCPPMEANQDGGDTEREVGRELCVRPAAAAGGGVAR